MVCRWAQELLGYQFSIIHRSNKMMADVDELTRRFGKLISQHCMIASILYHTEKIKRPEAYDEAVFTKKEKVKVRTDVQEDREKPILIIDNAIKSFETQHQVPL